MQSSINFTVTLQSEILSIVTSDVLKQMIILKSVNSVLDEQTWHRSLSFITQLSSSETVCNTYFTRCTGAVSCIIPMCY